MIEKTPRPRPDGPIISTRIYTMRFLAGNCRLGLLSCLLIAFALSTVAVTVMLSSPAVARAQDDANKPADDAAAKPSTNPIIHFFVSIGIMFGLLFAAISVGMVAL